MCITDSHYYTPETNCNIVNELYSNKKIFLTFFTVSPPFFIREQQMFHVRSDAAKDQFFCKTVPLWEFLVTKAMAPLSSTLAWKIPWMEGPGRLQSMGSLRVGHD